jgi:predicted transcriptional regulator
LSTLKKPYMRRDEFAKTNGQSVVAGKVMGQEIMDDKAEVIEMTADIVSAYVGNNSVSTADLPALIQSVHRALAGISGGPEVVEPAPKEPAVPLKKSITPDYLICLEDGRKFKSLKRHLRTKYNMSPDEYRAKWNLSKDYPMVAPNYAKARSDLAKQMGLGQGGRQAARRGRR